MFARYLTVVVVLVTFSVNVLAEDGHKVAPIGDLERVLREFRDEFILITPGEGRFPRSFLMGGNKSEEQPIHEVTFNYHFFIGKYEVRQEVWTVIMGNNPSRWKGERHSVEMVNYDEALEFCQRVTDQMRRLQLIGDKEIVRLPSEAEWEYCVRAGTRTRYSFGDDPNALGDYAWYSGNAAGNDPPVGAKLPNPWGLFDMHGYVWEWCLDLAHDDYQGAPVDGSAWLQGGDTARRVVRGGSWKDPAESLTCATRAGAFPHRDEQIGKTVVYAFRGGVDRSLRDDAIGLRCVIAPTHDHTP